MATFDAREGKGFLSALEQFGATQSVTEFLAGAAELSADQRDLVVDQALVLLNQLYVHLPLKEARHAIDPVQRLRLLRQRLGSISDLSFHSEMIDIFKRLRDAHTNYGLPRPYRGSIAFLPFLMEEYFGDDEARHFLVSRTLFGFSHSRFRIGVEITHWNGTLVGRAVQLNADREEGSNEAARFAFGLAAMTVRSLGSTLPPDEEWVTVSFLNNGVSHEILLPWRVWDQVADPRPDLSDETDSDEAGMSSDQMALSVNTRVHETHRARRYLFSPGVDAVAARVAPVAAAVRSADKAMGDTDLSGLDVKVVDLDAESLLPKVIQFSVYESEGREYGHIRIRTFGHSPIGQFVNEFLRILALMPGDGLILDVRGNGGGIILNGELLLQFLTPHDITPEPFHFINTPLTQTICTEAAGGVSEDAADRRADLAAQWGDSIAQSVSTGAVYSRGVPLTPPELANRFGQQYHGPVVLITDAMCYSTTDIFAAGFQDHGIGQLIGVDGNTGAGGANVWEHERHLVPLLPAEGSPIRSLPAGMSMRVAIRRCTRVGANAGQPVEDLGVRPDIVHRITEADLMNDNIDLITTAVTHLSTQVSRQLDLAPGEVAGSALPVTATTRNLDRVDCFVNGRPILTADVTDGDNLLQLPLLSQVVSRLQVKGYSAGALVAERVLQAAG